MFDKIFKYGRLTYISISKIRCIVHILALFLMVVMNIFVASGAIGVGFSSFKGGELDL